MQHFYFVNDDGNETDDDTGGVDEAVNKLFACSRHELRSRNVAMCVRPTTRNTKSPRSILSGNPGYELSAGEAVTTNRCKLLDCTSKYLARSFPDILYYTQMCRKHLVRLRYAFHQHRTCWACPLIRHFSLGRFMSRGMTAAEAEPWRLGAAAADQAKTGTANTSVAVQPGTQRHHRPLIVVPLIRYIVMLCTTQLSSKVVHKFIFLCPWSLLNNCLRSRGDAVQQYPK